MQFSVKFLVKDMLVKKARSLQVINLIFSVETFWSEHTKWKKIIFKCLKESVMYLQCRKLEMDNLKMLDLFEWVVEENKWQIQSMRNVYP